MPPFCYTDKLLRTTRSLQNEGDEYLGYTEGATFVGYPQMHVHTRLAITSSSHNNYNPKYPKMQEFRDWLTGAGLFTSQFFSHTGPQAGHLSVVDVV